MPESASARAIRFGPFEVNRHAGELRKHGIRIKLSGQPFEVLTLLLERPGEVVTYEELRAKLWQADTFVDFEHGLHAAVNKLRQALGDSAEHPRYVENLPRRGYRFVAAVRWAAEAPETPSVAPAEKQTAPEQMAASASVAQRRGALGRQGTTLLGIATVLVALGAGYFSLRNWRQPSPSAGSGIQSLAVLPLVNLSRDPEQEYFADGMTDELITDLAKIGALRVISRTSVMRYKGTKKSLPEIAGELNVDAVVEGTVLRSGNRVRITAQLIRAATEKHLWAESYEGDLSDILPLQGKVAGAIASEIRIRLTPQQQASLARARPVDPEAYQLYLKGRYHWNKRTLEGLRKAMEYFQQAVDKDPAYALAYAGLADTYVPLTNWGWLSPREAMPKARAAALKALEIDDRLAEAHVSLGMVGLVYDWDWPTAGKHFERSLALNPASPAAHLWYSNYLMALGRSDEALAEAKRAVDLDPVSPDLNHHIAWLLNMVRRSDEAIEQERKTLEMDPGFPPAHSVLAGAYLAKGMYREALAEAEKLSALSPGSPAALLSMASVHAGSGERSQALRELNELRALSKRRYVPSDYFAIVYLRLGDKDQAFTWLEKAYEERTGLLPWLKVSRTWDPLRSGPRFADLVRRMGFPP